MKKFVATFAFTVLFCAPAHAQKLAIGERAPELKVSEWITARPSDAKARIIEFLSATGSGTGERIVKLDSYAKDYSAAVSVVVVSRGPREKIEALLPAGHSLCVGIDAQGKSFAAWSIQYLPFCAVCDARGRVVWMGNPAELTDTIIEKAFKE